MPMACIYMEKNDIRETVGPGALSHDYEAANVFNDLLVTY
jgi:hypothetical protein